MFPSLETNAKLEICNYFKCRLQEQTLKSMLTQVHAFSTSQDAYSNKSKWLAGPMKAFKKPISSYAMNIKINMQAFTKSM